jgi:dynein heavy chain
MMCAIFKSLLCDSNSFDAETEYTEIKKYICRSFIFSYLWALGSNLIESSQTKFEEFVFNQFKVNSEAKILPEIKLFDVYLNTVNKTFENWNSIVPDFEYKTETSYFKLLVPTVNSIRYTYIIQKLIKMNQPVMLAGVSGKL